MANSQIKQYADMVNLQMAAEAFLRGATIPDEIRAALVAGNTANSKEPDPLASLFGGTSPRYKLIAHQDLTLNANKTIPGAVEKSGLSASVFYDTVTQQYTLSVRSTEFATSIRDWGDVQANRNEIADYGWAFGQINSLEAFWESLKNGSAANSENAVTIPNAADLGAFWSALQGGARINVTGYSLGGNIAEAFTELHRSEIAKTYLFNAAGTGESLIGIGFPGIWAKYKSVFDNPDSAYPTNQSYLGTPIYSALMDHRAKPNLTYETLYGNPRHALALWALAR